MDYKHTFIQVSTFTLTFLVKDIFVNRERERDDCETLSGFIYIHKVSRLLIYQLCCNCSKRNFPYLRRDAAGTRPFIYVHAEELELSRSQSFLIKESFVAR